MKDKKFGEWRLILLVQYITSLYEAFKTLRLRFMGLLRVEIVKYLKIKPKKNKNFLTVFLNILGCSVQGKHIQVLNLTIFQMTYLGQENDFVKS